MNQDTFLGGLQQQFDATKTQINQYRAALNCRVRRNVIEPSFAHVKINAPAGIYQAAFSLDDKLILIVNAVMYYLAGDNLLEIGPTTLDASADIVYHENVPAPSNFFVGPDDRYASTVSTTPLTAVLQDGVNQPWLLASNFAYRRAKTYAEWSYDSPEYVPIGTLMAFTGPTLFIASPDKTKEYRSVSGRPLDFVLAFNSISGAPNGTADSSALAVSTAKLTALVSAQDGGFIAATRYRTHAATPVPSILIFDEPYIQPRDLFPVGVVGRQAFCQINGQTVFVSSSGIQLFNETAQRTVESNNSPLGAPISPMLVKPIANACCAVVDDYAYFAVETVFGPGIVVYDMQTAVFVGIDTVSAPVKEFALVQGEGSTRLFYITTANTLFEIPLYTGAKAMATVYFGEWAPIDKDGKQDTGRRHRLKGLKFGLTDVRSAGYISVRPYTDRAEEQGYVIPIPAQELPLATGTFPFAGECASAVYPVKTSNTKVGYALGVRIDLAIDARLASIDIDTDVMQSDSPTFVTPDYPRQYTVVSDYRSVARETADFAATTGQEYWIEALGTDATYVLNGSERVTLPAGGHQAKTFKAVAGWIIFPAATAAVYDFSDLQAVVDMQAAVNGAFLLGSGDLTDTYSALFKFFDWNSTAVNAVAGDYIQLVTPRAIDFFGASRRPRYYLVAERDVDFYCLSFPESSGTPDELESTGEYAQWIRVSVQERAAITPKRLSVIVSAINPQDNAQFAEWNFSAMGIAAVVVSSISDFVKTTYNGALLLGVPVGARLDISTTPRAANFSVFLDMTATTDPHDKAAIVV